MAEVSLVPGAPIPDPDVVGDEAAPAQFGVRSGQCATLCIQRVEAEVVRRMLSIDRRTVLEAPHLRPDVQVPPFKRFPQGRATFADGDDLGREAHHLCAWCTYGTLLIILFEHAGQARSDCPYQVVLPRAKDRRKSPSRSLKIQPCLPRLLDAILARVRVRLVGVASERKERNNQRQNVDHR